MAQEHPEAVKVASIVRTRDDQIELIRIRPGTSVWSGASALIFFLRCALSLCVCVFLFTSLTAPTSTDRN